jgi:hypothetical protein
MTQNPANDDALMQAAALTFTMLRFEQDAAHASRSSDPYDQGEMGVDRFVFLPSWRSTAAHDVVAFLAGLTCPALLFPTTMRGVVSLMLLDELAGERKAWAQKTLDNHLVGINEFAAQFFPPLDGNSNVLLEVQGETHIISLDVLRLWSQRFNAPAGWSLGDSRNDPRAPAQIRLISSDGRINPPWEAYAPWQRPVP